MPLALDAAGHPDPAAAKAAGYLVIAQYLGGAYAESADYVRQASIADVGLVSVWELGAQASLGGAGAGVVDATAAIRAARALGQPQGTGIYTTVDFDVTDVELAAVVEYVRAFATAVTQSGFIAGCYGPPLVLNAVQAIVALAWESAGWEHGDSLPWVNLRQRVQQVDVAGTTCDVNDILALTVGAWNLSGPWPAPPTPSPVNPPSIGPNLEVDGVTITELTFNETSDANGNGWIGVNAPENQILSVTAKGPYPPDDGYGGAWKTPAFGKQTRAQDGYQTVVSWTGGAPDEPITVYVQVVS